MTQYIARTAWSVSVALIHFRVAVRSSTSVYIILNLDAEGRQSAVTVRDVVISKGAANTFGPDRKHLSRPARIV